MWGRRRFAASLGVVAVAALLVAAVVAQESRSTESRFVRPIPSVEEQKAELGDLEGPVTIIPPAVTPNPALRTEDLQRHGAYRLITGAFVGELRYEGLPPYPPGVVSSDPAVMEKSPLYVPVEGLPEGYSRFLIDSFDGESNGIVRQIFRHRDASDASTDIEVVRKLTRTPIDVSVPATDGSSWLTLGLTRVGPYEAITYRPAPSEPPSSYGYVGFFDGGVETIVSGWGVPFDTLVEIATSIAFATSENTP